MFRYILRKINFLKTINENSHKENLTLKKISSNLENNLNLFSNIIGKSDDIIMRNFKICDTFKTSACLIFLDGMVDKSTINENIMKPLMYDNRSINAEEKITIDDIEIIKTSMLSVGQVKKENSLDKLIHNCLTGDSILLIDGFDKALIIPTKGWEARGIEEPKTDIVIRGPREGFTETLRSNTTLLRRKICDPSFTLETIQLGEKTKTKISIAYLKGLVNPKLIKEVKYRLSKIKIDAILESGYIEEFIEDAPFSLFSTIGNSEKPDVVAARLLEGRVAIFVDGTPFVLTIPMLFIESFQSAEDYYSRPYYTTLIRILRFTAFIISILAPAIYVALTTFRQEVIPTPLLITMAASREGVPFPAVIEALIMIITFEILREAGIRLPRAVGQTVSIVGALVIGEAAVSAGLIAAPMVIVVAITAISSFVISAHNDSISILRLIFIVLSGFMGMFGITIGLLYLLIHLTSLRSFGTPYFSPIAPLSFSDLKDTFIRVPLWAMLTRPRTIGWHNLKREEFNKKDNPSNKK